MIAVAASSVFLTNMAFNLGLFLFPQLVCGFFLPSNRKLGIVWSSKGSSEEWTSDFDDYVGSFDSDELLFPKMLQDEEENPVSMSEIFSKKLTSPDYTACRTRQFSLGRDIIVTDYVGNMGFDEGKQTTTTNDKKVI